MSLSILPYIGSKRTDIKFFELYFPNDIKTICEPFSGSSYVSLYLYSKNDKIKTIINDNDNNLIKYYQQMKNNSIEQIENYNNLVETINDKIKYKNFKDNYLNSKLNDNLLASHYLFYNKFHGTRIGLYPNKKINKLNIDKYKIYFEWIKNIIIFNLDYTEIFNKYKNDKDMFLFIDPPYLSSYNAYYDLFSKDIGQDNTKMFIDILSLLKTAKCKIMLIINKNALTDFIYKDFIKGSYDRIYQFTKKKAIHLIITNYK